MAEPMAADGPTKICKSATGEAETNQLFDSVNGPEPASLMTL